MSRLKQWIPAAERLPAPNTTVLTYQKALVAGKRDHFVVDFQSEGYGDWYRCDGYHAVTHWMPLPEAPK